MPDCQDDPDDPPEGTLAEAVEEFEELAATFRADAEANRTKQGNAKEPEPPEQPEGTRLPDQEFNARSYLLVPHFATGNRRRPIPGRPEASPPLRSDAIEVLRDGERTTRFTAGAEHTITCTLQNVGGLEASNANVELYADNEPLDATIDTNPTSGTLELHPDPSDPSNQAHVGGFTSLPPGPDAAVILVTFASDAENPMLFPDNVIDYNVVSVSEGRTFRAMDDYAGYGNLHGGWVGRLDEYASAIRTRVYEYPLDDPPGLPHRPSPNPNPLLYWLNVVNDEDPTLLTEVDVTLTTDPNNEPAGLDLLNNVERAQRIGKRYATVPPSGETEVSFSYTPSSPPSGHDALTQLYVRTYDMGQGDTPAHWSRLDHTESRFVGRYEVYW